MKLCSCLEWELEIDKIISFGFKIIGTEREVCFYCGSDLEDV